MGEGTHCTDLQNHETLLTSYDSTLFTSVLELCSEIQFLYNEWKLEFCLLDFISKTNCAEFSGLAVGELFKKIEALI